MARKMMVLIIIAMLFSVAGVNGEGADEKTAAIDASQRWLSAVDRYDYDQSWKQAASLFKQAVQISQWARSMKAVREPLGKMISREVLSADYLTSLPGAPDGAYVVIRYATVFENKKSAVETVTPMLDKDGIWRVSGYFIK